MSRQLTVAIAGLEAGALTQSGNGSLSFSYAPDYMGVPLSLSMPVSQSTYGDNKVRPYLEGLLPEDSEVRRRAGLEFDVSGRNPFALLSVMGLDCPGAVQVFAPGQDQSREDRLVPLTNRDIAERLRQGRERIADGWLRARERWSLGGAQAKFALRREDGRWFQCEGGAATTHILKPGIPGLKLQALNEYVCLKTARAVGLRAAETQYLLFEDEPAIVSTRYDRARDAAGQVVRIHQEDLCQAFSVMPGNKYPQDGGPAANEIVGLLLKTGAPAQKNVRGFLQMLFFNYLTGATDAHAKNYSVLLDRDAAYLAPLYDVASVLPYTRPKETIKLAMGIAGEARAGRVSARRLQKFADDNGLEEAEISGGDLAEMMAALATEIPAAMAHVLNEESQIPGMDELEERLLKPVTKLCQTSLVAL
ncbi:type II toxin-antitoxin system HipA family toxin [Olsenella sp. YH-ols2217]|uniref:Type II toxin-antitoxin system HipA family toxin n=1 Tax=Kribbibacterium absianum TaxID=3044210 RepID=A0ABT6ZKD3_9ACTN|nr:MULTISPECIES: type II toxin-antitoxin system HipA family toxin [unclassified Olsenella]MDJ1122404.1 type II toxin-antitoxin system HipA family toxin [Olsenella sp. YH-ols2216]MDJ1129342.1 type II toxin-antitoxin system HipA family toxin [Olsenella sp. YH-ols2217]